MSTEQRDATGPEPAVEVSVDRSGARPRIVVTDSDCESAWLSVSTHGCCSLAEWR